MSEQTTHALATAIVLWKRGEPVPVNITAALLEEGFDVDALEAKYAA